MAGVVQASTARARATGQPLPVLLAAVLSGAVAITLATVTPSLSDQTWFTAGILFLCAGVAAGTVLEFRWSSLTPTRAVLTAGLLLLPLTLVPLVMIGGQLLPVLVHRRPDLLRSLATQTVLASPVFVVVALLAAAGVDPAGGVPGPWWLYLIALSVLAAVDFGLRQVVERPRRPRVGPFGLAVRLLGIDALLVAIGLGAVIAARVSWSYVLFLAAPIVLMAVLSAGQRGLGQQVSRAKTEARIDPLTGLGNRRAWLEAVEAASRTRPTLRAPIGIVMADLDNLKITNDTLGHPVGDELIAAVGAACAEAAPSGSVVCRIGGDEFAMLIRDAVGERTGPEVAARLRELVANRGHIHGVRLSAGVGAADSPPEGSVEAAVELADAMVLAEKRGRRPQLPRQRNRVVPISRIADDSEPTVKLPGLSRHLPRSRHSTPSN